jgi:hypothetical protein
MPMNRSMQFVIEISVVQALNTSTDGNYHSHGNKTWDFREKREQTEHVLRIIVIMRHGWSSREFKIRNQHIMWL